jgi:hypothetical protein
MVKMQNELTQPFPLLDNKGQLQQVGWSRQPLLDCNLEKAHFYPFRALQFLRIKRWDYYSIFTPRRFFSATVADLGYAGNIFVYTLDFETGALHEEGLIIPLGKGIRLPRNSQEGETYYSGQGATLRFQAQPGCRIVTVDWPKFHGGRGIKADIRLDYPFGQESMNIVIPIPGKRFYFNRKVNCLPAVGTIQYGDEREDLQPDRCLGGLDWGRGVWEYSSFWNWASASGLLPDGRRVGLNLGCGFGDLSAATENCLVLDGKVHKLEQVKFDYVSGDYMKPWKFIDSSRRMALEFIPFKDRMAQTNLGIIASTVHQMFGRYSGEVLADDGERIHLEGLVGFAEEHQARW